MNSSKLVRWISLRSIRKGILFVASVYMLSWILKGIFLSVYVVPTSSMYPTIHSGDFIVTYKFPYRLKTPEFYPLLAVPFPHYSKAGFIKPKKNDVFVFSSPINNTLHPSLRMTLVKRLAGVPGDTLFIWKDAIIEAKKAALPDSVQRFIVPERGYTVDLNAENAQYWGRLIKRDGTSFEINKQNQIIVNDKKVNEYIFQQNFYFMMGDNKGNTRDSRHWGAVPENLLIGRAARIIWRDGGLAFQKL